MINLRFDDYSIEELQNIIDNRKTQKLQHEAHLLRMNNPDLWNFIIDEYLYDSNVSEAPSSDDYDYDNGY